MRMAKIVKIIGAFANCPPAEGALRELNINADFVFSIYVHTFNGEKTGFTVLSLPFGQSDLYTKTSLEEVIRLISD